MKHRVAWIWLLLLTAGPAMAQTAATAPPSGSQAPQSTAAQINDPVKEAAIRHLLDLTGSGKLGGQMMDAMMPQMRSIVGSLIPQNDRAKAFLDAFFQRFRARVSDESIVAIIIPIYAKHYSLEDIQALNQLYESPLGQRVVRELPQITKESQAAGSEMGQKAAMDTLRDMSVDYPELKQILPPDDAAAAPSGKSTPDSTPTPRR
jgi:uncharacterized protein